MTKLTMRCSRLARQWQVRCLNIRTICWTCSPTLPSHSTRPAASSLRQFFFNSISPKSSSSSEWFVLGRVFVVSHLTVILCSIVGVRQGCVLVPMIFRLLFMVATYCDTTRPGVQSLQSLPDQWQVVQAHQSARPLEGDAFFSSPLTAQSLF